MSPGGGRGLFPQPLPEINSPSVGWGGVGGQPLSPLQAHRLEKGAICPPHTFFLTYFLFHVCKDHVLTQREAPDFLPGCWNTQLQTQGRPPTGCPGPPSSLKWVPGRLSRNVHTSFFFWKAGPYLIQLAAIPPTLLLVEPLKYY